MVTTVNRSQQVVTSGLAPRSAYSRIVTVRASAAGGGVYGYGVGPALGQGLWLVKVSAVLQLRIEESFARTHFSLHIGQVKPTRYQDVREWDHIIEFGTYAGFRGMVVYGNSRQFTWDLVKRFQGTTNRLGVLLYNESASIAVVHVFFTVSEG